MKIKMQQQLKKCPPGMFCMTSSMIISLLVVVGIAIAIAISISSPFLSPFSLSSLFQKTQPHMNKNKERVDVYVNNYIPPNPPNPPNPLPWGGGDDVLLNPYSPPLRDERYFPLIPPMGPVVPINVPTRPSGIDSNYRQVGILTPSHGPSTNQILPLMGRPLFSSRQKWQYYTISNQHNNVKLPVRVKGKSGTSDYGVDELYTGDCVFVEGDKARYTATLYDNDTMRYLPF
jgi:hypothetical protein